MFEILLPRIDAGMTEGTVVEWLRKEGDSVQKGEAIAKIEGEKIIFEVETSKSGVLGKILTKVGTIVPVGNPIAIVYEQGETTSESKDVSGKFTGPKILATPAAKRLAKERGIDLANIKGSGPEGMILEKDLPSEAGKNTLENGKGGVFSKLEISKSIPLAGIRKTIAERLTSSYQTAPHVAITMEVDISKALNARKEISETRGIKIPVTALLVCASARALKEKAIINSTFENNEIKLIKDINIGVAIALEEGLLVPVIHHADKKNVFDVSDIITRLIEKARTRSLSIDELQNGTFTISNLGAHGVDIFTPIINPPQAAILGVGRISERLLVRGNTIAIVPMVTLTLVFDHRIIDGVAAAEFLRRIRDVLESAQTIFQD